MVALQGQARGDGKWGVQRSALTASWLGSCPTGPLTLFKFASPLIIKNLKNLSSAAAPLSLCAAVGSHKARDGRCKIPPLHECKNSGVLNHTLQGVWNQIFQIMERVRFWEVKIPIPKGHQDSSSAPTLGHSSPKLTFTVRAPK